MPEPGPTVFWICGAAGAGKSVAAWALFEGLATEGLRVAYVDIDQLGMLYPAGSDDPERHRLKAEALLAMLPGYALARAHVVVVSGVVDPLTGPDTALATNVDLTLCVLLADPATLRERILARGWGEQDADAAVAENAALRDASFVHAAIETSGLSVADTVERLRVTIRTAEPAAAPALSMVPSPADLGVVVVTGPRAVGSSTVGFGLAMTRWSAGLRTSFVDLQQLAFLCSPDSTSTTDHQLAILQLATLHAFLASRGVGLLVVSGHLGVEDRSSLSDALKRASVTIVRLRADSAALEEHVVARAVGSQARLAGDDLLGASPSYRAAVVAGSIAEQERLDASARDDAVVDVTNRTAPDVVAEVERLLATRHP